MKVQQPEPSKMTSDSGTSNEVNKKEASEYIRHSDVASGAQVAELPGWKVILIWFSISCAALCTFLDEGIIATAIPRITDQFHSLPDVGWYGSAYQMTLCSFQMIYGRLYQQFNIKIIFLLALAIFEIGSLICALSPTSTAFIIGRSIAGLGAAGLQSGSVVLMSALLPPKKLPFYLSLLGVFYGVAAVLGPVAGGLITNSYLTWRWCFYINLPIAAVPGAATIFLIQLPKAPIVDGDCEKDYKSWAQKLQDLDYFGMALLLPAITVLILALQFSSLYSWADGRTIACIVVAGVLAIAFMAEEWWQGEKALVPPRLMKTRMIFFASTYALCFDSAFFMLVYYVPLWFQAVQGISPEQSALRYLALCLAFIITIFLSGWAVTKLGYTQPLMLAGTILVSVGAGLLSTLGPSSGLNHYIPFQVIAGLGVGLATQLPVVTTQTFLPEADQAMGLGIVLFFQCLGPATFISVGETVFASFLTSGIASSGITGIEPDIVRGSGATELRTLVPAEDLDVLLGVYSHAVTRNFLVAGIMAAVSVIGVVGIRWERIPGGGKETGETDETITTKDMKCLSVR